MGIAVLILSSIANAAPCADPAKLVADAELALAGSNFEGVEARMKDLDAAWACGSVADPRVLGQMWLIEGTWLFYQEDLESAKASFAAAARVAPGLSPDAYGAEVKAVWDEVAGAPAPPNVEIRGENTDGWFVAVDGLRRTLPTRVEAGVHLFQVGATAEDIRFGKLADVSTSWTLKHGLGVYVPPKPDPVVVAPVPAWQATPLPVPPPPPSGPRVVGLHLGAGGWVVLGDPVGDDGDAMFEPATKVLIPVELGLRLQVVEAFWMRFSAFAAPLVNGKLLYQGEGGEIQGSLAGIGGTVGMGGTVGHVDVGLLGGGLWPGRIPLRSLVAYRLGETGVRIEVEGGVNIGTPPEQGASPRIEPSVALLLTIDPLFASK